LVAVILVLATMPLLRILDAWLDWSPILAEETLDRTIERIYVLLEDLALAREADLQGLGGASRVPWQGQGGSH